MTEYTHQGNSVAAAPLCLRFEDVFVLKKFGEFSLLLPENTLKKKKNSPWCGKREILHCFM